MTNFRYPQYILFAPLALAPLIGAAQTFLQDPINPQAKVFTSQYESSFSGYRRYQDPELMSWRNANEEVVRVTSYVSHAGHAIENTTPDVAHEAAPVSDNSHSRLLTPLTTHGHSGTHKP